MTDYEILTNLRVCERIIQGNQGKKGSIIRYGQINKL